MNTRLLHYLFVVVLSALMIGCDGREPFYKVVSKSMAPTLNPGDTIVVRPAGAVLNRWDVVVFRPLAITIPDEVWCLRLVGLPGETLSFTPGGKLLVDGLEVKCASSPTIVFTMPPSVPGIKLISLPFHVPADAVFLLGDNSGNANDSRYWGALPVKNIIGVVINR